MKDFEDQLSQVGKPGITNLRHREILCEAITNVKAKSVVSWWWLSMPLFIIASFVMKSFYQPETTLISNIQEMEGREKFTSMFLFLVLPFVLIIINGISIRKIFFLSGSQISIEFLKVIWIQGLMILLSLMILIIYLL